MATYKNRPVTIIQELPHPQGDMVEIEHRDPSLAGSHEIVPTAAVVVSKDEKKSIDDQRKRREGDANDFQLEGEERPTPVPTVHEVRIQRAAEDNVVLAEKQKKENEEWAKKHPHAPSQMKQQLDAVKVVPYRDETEKSLSKEEKAKK